MSDSPDDFPSWPIEKLRREYDLVSDLGCEKCGAMVTDYEVHDGERIYRWWQCGRCTNRQAFVISYLRDLLRRLRENMAFSDEDERQTTLRLEIELAAYADPGPDAERIGQWGREYFAALTQEAAK